MCIVIWYSVTWDLQIASARILFDFERVSSESRSTPFLVVQTVRFIAFVRSQVFAGYATKAKPDALLLRTIRSLQRIPLTQATSSVQNAM